MGLADLAGARTLLIVPMLKENELIGAIGIYRQEVRPFTEKQIALVKNFAAQVVIAIEIGRLHRELRERTEEVEKLNQQLIGFGSRPARHNIEGACTENPTMKTLTEYLNFHTETHRAYVHITPQVEEVLRKSGVKEGMVLVSAMHITAGVYVNDNERGLIEDIDQWLEHLAPFRKDYKHHNTGEDNGDSHLKALLIHHEVIVPITGGKLDLGKWQRIFYAEFDGQRDKRVIVKVLGE